MSKKYDVVIIGAGPGGYAAAIRLSQLDKKVCVVDLDEDRLGGVCLNEGCIPAKSILYSAKLFSLMKKSNDYGIEANVKAPDMKKIITSSQNATLKLRNGLKALFKKYNIEFISGRAKIISKNKIAVTLKDKKEELEADNIIIATGSSPKIPSNIKPDAKSILTSHEAIKLNKIPKNKIKIIQGDVKKKITKQSLKQLGKFDKIMMARPNLKNTFLEQALLVSKKNTIIFYHGFTHQDNLKDLTNQLEQEAKKLKRKIKITNITKAGDIAPFKFRYRIEIKVMN